MSRDKKSENWLSQFSAKLPTGQFLIKD
jgi:hypothetical protein